MKNTLRRTKLLTLICAILLIFGAGVVRAADFRTLIEEADFDIYETSADSVDMTVMFVAERTDGEEDETISFAEFGTADAAANYFNRSVFEYIDDAEWDDDISIEVAEKDAYQIMVAYDEYMECYTIAILQDTYMYVFEFYAEDFDNSIGLMEEIGVRISDLSDMALLAKDAPSPLPPPASSPVTTGEADKPISLIVDGVEVATDSPPVIEDGRTLAPLRAVVESLGQYDVEWEEATQTIFIYDTFFELLNIEMQLGSLKAQVLDVNEDGDPAFIEMTLDVPAKIINGRTMVPVRFIAEALGCSVSWDGENRAVVVEP